MEKIKSSFLFGTIILLISNLITKVIGAIYRIPLLKILGMEGLGQYQMILPIFALFLVLSSGGLVVTLSKFVSKATEQKNLQNSKKILYAGLTIALFFSGIFSLLLIAISPKISSIQSSGGLYKSYFAIAPAIVIGSLLAVFRGYFLGKKKMIYAGSQQVIEAVCKLIFSLILSYKLLKYGYSMAVLGAIIGIGLSEFVALIFSIVIYQTTKKKDYFVLKRSLKNKKTVVIKKTYSFDNQNAKVYHSKNRYLSFGMAIKKVFSFSFFVMLQACILPLVNAIDSIVIVPLLIRAGIIKTVAYSLYGIENGIVSSIVALPTVIASAVGSAVIPNIKTGNKNLEATSKNIKNSFNIVWLTSIFFVVVFVFFSREITSFLYGSGLNNNIMDELNISSDLLRINSFNILYLNMLSLSTSVLQGLEKNKVPVLNLAIAGILRLFLMIVLLSIDKINIYGTAIADMAFFSFAFMLNLREIKKTVNFSFKIKNFLFLPALCCLTMGGVMLLLKMGLSGLLGSKILTMLIMACGGIIYLVLLLATKLLNFREIFLSFKKRAK